MIEKNDSERIFDYIWVSRCSGTNVNYNVEYRLTPQAPQNHIIPLIEVINENIFPSYAQQFRRRYGEIMVDFPIYLLESNNRFIESVQELSIQYPDQLVFFQKFRHLIDIPVVSASHVGVLDYSDEYKILEKLKNEFDRVAVRVRVPTFDLTRARAILGSYESLFNIMEQSDILLLDVFNLSGIENQIRMNLQTMSDLSKKKDLEVFILNAFEPYDQGHNFGPLFSYLFDLDGFGDFATEKRFPATGGRPSKRIIRYYYWDRYMLKELAEINYHLAVDQLKNSNYWVNHQSHIPSCNGCDDVHRNRFTESHSFWKRFRMLHYLNSISVETMLQFSQVVSAEDLDPDGYDIIYNVSDI